MSFMSVSFYYEIDLINYIVYGFFWLIMMYYDSIMLVLDELT